LLYIFIAESYFLLTLRFNVTGFGDFKNQLGDFIFSFFIFTFHYVEILLAKYSKLSFIIILGDLNDYIKLQSSKDELILSVYFISSIELSEIELLNKFDEFKYF